MAAAETSTVGSSAACSVFSPLLLQLLLISTKAFFGETTVGIEFKFNTLLLFCRCLLKDIVMFLSLTVEYRCRAESQALQRELAGLSERYSQKCLELNRAEQNSAEREREICRKERDLEQLRKENQVS